MISKVIMQLQEKLLMRLLQALDVYELAMKR
jgi:hypothetical protein